MKAQPLIYMDIHRITFPPSALLALPRPQLSAFLLLGHLLNEANWLQKLLLYSVPDDDGGVPEKHARLALSVTASHMLAAKIHEGWLKLTSGKLATTLGELPQSKKLTNVRAKLRELLRKDSLIHKIRNHHAFHYPPALSLDALPGIAQNDCAMYLTEHVGDTLSLVSALSAAAEMNSATGLSHVGKTVDRVRKEINKATRLYSDFLHGSLQLLIDASLGDSFERSVVAKGSAAPLVGVRAPFFLQANRSSKSRRGT